MGATYIDEVTDVIDIVVIEVGVHCIQVDKIFISSLCAFLTVLKIFFQPLEKKNDNLGNLV